MFNVSNNMSIMQFRANTLLDATNMQNVHNNMHNMHNMQSWFQYAEYALLTLLMQQSLCSLHGPDVNLGPQKHRAVIGSAQVEVGSACQLLRNAQ